MPIFLRTKQQSRAGESRNVYFLVFFPQYVVLGVDDCKGVGGDDCKVVGVDDSVENMPSPTDKADEVEPCQGSKELEEQNRIFLKSLIMFGTHSWHLIVQI